MPETVVITGATDGIGKQVALRLAASGARLLLIGRQAQRGQDLLRTIRAETSNTNVEFLQADLSLMSEVRRVAGVIQSTVTALDGLIHCAGVTLRQRTLTAEGLETVFAVQCLARVALSEALLPLLQASPNGRVVNVSGGGDVTVAFEWDNLQGEKHYDGVWALRHESVANDLMILEQARRYPRLRWYNYGPGYVKTGLLHDMHPAFQWVSRLAGVFIGITPEQAADDIVALLNGNQPSGLYGRRGKSNTPQDLRADPASGARLWEQIQRLLGK